MVNMLDAHCHLDLYPDPSQTALNAESSGAFVVCVTNTPSAFLAARPHVRQFKKVRLALGLHPLSAEFHTDDELSQFRKLVDDTSFIGEIGLDFSREGRETRNEQLNSFQFVLRCLNNEPKFVTIHSRQAESAVLELLQNEYPHPVVFHWYSGTLKTLESTIQAGHFFSINPAMVRSVKGRAAIAQIPRERILTESDGPFINIGSRTVEPSDVQTVEEALGVMWGVSTMSARNIVQTNFQKLIVPLKRASQTQEAKAN
jgi:TatD DNase family protein